MKEFKSILLAILLFVLFFIMIFSALDIQDIYKRQKTSLKNYEELVWIYENFQNNPISDGDAVSRIEFLKSRIESNTVGESNGIFGNILNVHYVIILIACLGLVFTAGLRRKLNDDGSEQS